MADQTGLKHKALYLGIGVAILVLLSLIALLMLRDYRKSLTPCEQLNWHYLADIAERECKDRAVGILARTGGTYGDLPAAEARAVYGAIGSEAPDVDSDALDDVLGIEGKQP